MDTKEAERNRVEVIGEEEAETRSLIEARREVATTQVNEILSNFFDQLKRIGIGQEDQTKGRKMSDLPDILSIEEVARFLDVGGWTVRNLIRGRRLRAFKLGRKIKVKKEELERFLKFGL